MNDIVIGTTLSLYVDGIYKVLPLLRNAAIPLRSAVTGQTFHPLPPNRSAHSKSRSMFSQSIRGTRTFRPRLIHLKLLRCTTLSGEFVVHCDRESDLGRVDRYPVFDVIPHSLFEATSYRTGVK